MNISGGSVSLAASPRSSDSAYQSITALLGLLIQLFLVSRVFDRFGIHGALLVLPLVTLLGYGLLSLLPLLTLALVVLIAENSIPVTEIADYTGFPEMMAGRVKTLHPTVHGGILYTALDDVTANVLYRQGRKAHTARCEVRYRQMAVVGETLKLKGWIENERRRLVMLKGEVRRASDDALIADCESSFMLEKT